MHETRASRWGIGAALLLLWLVWGSTYLVVTWVLPVAPPFVISASRFLAAGPLLLLAAAVLGEPRPTLAQARSAAIVGLFLFVGGNGGTVWSQLWLPSSLTAVMVGLVPLWLVLIGALTGDRPHPRRILGVLVGLLGVAGLVGGVGGHVEPVGVVIVVGATACWATGTTLARRLPMPASVAYSTATQMTAGSAGLWVAALLSGQVWDTRPELIDVGVLVSFAWLVGGGSVAALLAYNWLLRVTTPAVATTYAYVNPLVAVWLGWWLGGEALSAAQLACSALIVGAVALVTTAPTASSRPTPSAPLTPPVPAERPSPRTS